MKRYKRGFMMLLMIILTGFFIVPRVGLEWRSWIERYQTGSSLIHSNSISSSLVYPVKPRQWISFNIEEGTQQLKIITNAHIANPDNVSIADSWKYILRYQLLDRDGEILTDQLYYQRSRLSSYRNDKGDIFFGNFYSGHPLTPLDGRLIKLSMRAIQQASSIRLSFVQQSPEVEEISVRLYVPAKISDHRLVNTWLRMSDKHKEIMAKPSVYPATLLSNVEKINLLKHQWQAVGPKGVEGKDYIARTLYIVKEIESEKLSESRVAAGLQLDLNHPGIIAIPEQGGELKIQLTSLDGSALTQPVALQLNWFGRSRDQRWQRRAQWEAEKDSLSYPVQGGLLQIKADQAVLVHAFLNNKNQQSVDITPKPIMITGYSTLHGVDYQVLHVNNQATAVRVDLRQIFASGQPGIEEEVKFQWFNSQQQLIRSGILTINNAPSFYDRITGDKQQLKISDPVSYYLDIPAKVSRLRLSSQQDNLIVNAYNQPYRYKKNQRVPESSFVSVDKKDWHPSWFLLSPDNQQSLLKQQAVVKIAAQYRPPVDDPVLLANQYLWEDFRPLESTEARFILTARNTTDYRDEALASVYCQLPVNTVRSIHLKSYGNRFQISPELIYIRSQKKPFDLSVFIDQQLILDMSAMGQQGAFRLSNLSHGPHRIKLKTQASGRWLINYLSHCSSRAYIKRRVFKLNRQLTFIYTNNQVADKTFSAHFYTLVNNDKRSIIEVSIEPLQKHPVPKIKESWTFSRRSYDIRPAKGESSMVLNKHGYYLNSGERFFIPFNRDMPKGQYRIKISLKQGASGYLSLSQVIPGAHEQQRFYRETNDQIN